MYFINNICFKYWFKFFISSIIQIDNLYKIGIQLSKNEKLVLALHCDTFNKTFIFWFTKCIFAYLSMSLLRFLVNLYLF